MRHACIESDSGHIEEQSLLDFAGIDRPQTAVERDLQCRRCIERDAKFAGEAIAGSAWHQRQRRVGIRQRACDLVHRPVATPRDDRRDAARDSSARELVRMTRSVGHEHIRRIGATRREKGSRLRRTSAGDVYPAARARDRIDDDSYRGNRRSTFGGRNQTSSPGRRDISP